MAVIAELEKNQKEKIRISIEEYRGSKFVDCRVFWEDQEGQWKPSRKGIALNGGCLGEVINALEKARKELAGGE